MVDIGYAISSEEHHPNDIILHAKWAEEAGFSFAMISDHFHPWIDKQGHSPFVWNLLGALAHATTRIKFGTGVTCPIIRIHPVIMAQAAATTAAMMPGRFWFGIGTGENLNEHVVGEGWPAYDIRADMFEEAIEIIRLLWEGGEQSYYGQYYNVENARIYTLPDELPPLYLAAAGPKAAEVAADLGDGLINFAPDAEVVKTFSKAGGKGPKIGQATVCYGEDEAAAKKLATEIWPIAGMIGEIHQELPTPAHFAQVAQMVREEDVAKKVICGNDPARHIENIQKYIDAGYDHIYIHQVGPDQAGFIEFYKKNILPAFKGK